jgi:hypothetical protein
MPIEVLPSAAGRAAAENLSEFVRRARNDITAFGRDLDFDAPVWNVTAASVKRLSTCMNDRLYFTTAEGGAQKSIKGRIPLSEPFGSFIKAVVRRRQEKRPKTASNHALVIRAGRYLHDVLDKRGHDPCQLVAADFHAAAARCRQRETPASQYRIGLSLADIAETMNRHGIAKLPIDFKNPFSRVDDGSRLGKEHERRRATKLPTEAALDALSRLANLVTEPADVVRMRCIELLVCGGWRINEVLALPIDCEVTEPAVQNGNPVLDANGRPIERYGIRYFAEKGFGPGIKWIPTAMVDVAKRAVADIRRHTGSARDVAVWLEANPGRAFLPPEFRSSDRDALVPLKDINRMLGMTALGAANNWAQTYGLRRIKVNQTMHVQLRDLEEALLSEQPSVKATGIPLKLSEYLFLIHDRFLRSDQHPNPCLIRVVSIGQIADFLGGRPGIRSVFERFGLAEPDGRPIKMTSHMLRHWLNTLMQQGGMGQHEIARWSGRKDIGQNGAYDHVSAVELAEKARHLMQAGRARGVLATMHEQLPPVDREKFRDAVFTTAHTTDLGMCANDWSLMPCPVHAGCGACSDAWIEKGNEKQCARAETLLDEQRWLLARAEQEAHEGAYGASNYVDHGRRMVEGLERIIAIHGDPSIPDGTLVQPNASMPSLYINRPLDDAAVIEPHEPGKMQDNAT